MRLKDLRTDESASIGIESIRAAVLARGYEFFRIATRHINVDLSGIRKICPAAHHEKLKQSCAILRAIDFDLAAKGTESAGEEIQTSGGSHKLQRRNYRARRVSAAEN
jgi:hypothetical protein